VEREQCKREASMSGVYLGSSGVLIGKMDHWCLQVDLTRGSSSNEIHTGTGKCLVGNKILSAAKRST
jgi:hypothetical protein